MRIYGALLVFASALAAMPLTIGCAQQKQDNRHCMVTPTLPLVERGNLEPDPRSLPALAGPEQSLLAGPAQFRELNAAQVQCLAASNADISNLLMREREIHAPRLPIASIVCIHDKQRERTRSCIFEYSAQEVQNQASALALQAFFHLAEAEGQAQVAEAASQSLQYVVLQSRQWKER